MSSCCFMCMSLEHSLPLLLYHCTSGPLLQYVVDGDESLSHDGSSEQSGVVGTMGGFKLKLLPHAPWSFDFGRENLAVRLKGNLATTC